jgi:hypothetical protein
MHKQQPGALIAGLGLLITGGWLIVAQATTSAIGFDRLWPVIPAIFGLALLVNYNRRTGEGLGSVLAGIFIMLTSAFLCTFTLELGNLAWKDLLAYSPVFLLIVGASLMFIGLISGGDEQGLLIPAYAIGGLGLLLMPFTAGALRGPALSQVIRLWPLLVILTVLGVVLRLRSGRRSERMGKKQSQDV